MAVTLSPPVTPQLNGSPFLAKPSTPLQSIRRPTSLLTPPITPFGDSFKLSSDEPQSIPSHQFERLTVTPKLGEDKRPLSDNELSYFLPSRADGVNDMYLHHTLNAPASLLHPDRVLALWAYQLARHPLLASHLQVNSYQVVSFVSPHPGDVNEALLSAEERLIYIEEHDEAGKDVDIIDSYLNGPRTLSNDRLAMLVIADRGSVQDEKHTFEVMLLATHFLGDGMALHTFMNEFYTLLSSSSTPGDFAKLLSSVLPEPTSIPESLEDRMPKAASSLVRAVGKEECRRNDAKLVGGQSFPSNPVKSGRRTVVPTFAYSKEETKAILAKCKANGVTIAHAMFALCNLAWAKKTGDRVDPCLIYSALNLRPNMLPSLTSSCYFHLAVGYFNIVLPTLFPSDLTTSELFWHRARLTKNQTVKAVKSPFVVSRSRETNQTRRERAVKWAKIDDEEEEAKARKEKEAQEGKVEVTPNGGLGLGLGMSTPERKVVSEDGQRPGPKFAPLRAAVDTPLQTPAAFMPQTPATASTPSTATKQAQSKPAAMVVSQKALMGVSMLGNLDGMYKHTEFGGITLQSLTTGSRQRPGGLLLFAYTFTGKLWLSLGYDINGFAPGAIEGFWDEVQALVKEVLL